MAGHDTRFDRVDEIHQNLYERINDTDTKLSELIGQTSMLVSQNDKLMKFLEKDGQRFQRIIYTLFAVVMVLVGAVVFGAIGKEGFYAVRTLSPATAQDSYSDSVRSSSLSIFSLGGVSSTSNE